MNRLPWWRVAGVWLLAMAALALASPLWREADWWLFARQLRDQAPPLQDELVLLDVPYDDDLAVFRQRLLAAMDGLARTEAAPRALVFDVEFVNDPRLLPELQAAMARLRALQTRLFAVVNPVDGKRLDPLYMNRHARALYEQALDGMGHTVFDHAAGLAKYDPLLDLGDGQRVPALAVQVAEALFKRPPDADNRPIVLRLGDATLLQPRTLRLDPASLALQGPPPLAALTRGRIVVLGARERDRPLAEGPSGPEHLLWALSARGLPPEQAESRVLASPGLLLTLVAATGALAAALAWVVYAMFPRSPWRQALIGAVALGVPLALLVGASLALGRAGLVLPQLTLPALGGVLAAGLSLWFVRRHLAWVALQAEPPPLAEAYDVFVSYSRTDPAHVQWVRDQLVAPLSQALRPDGRPFRVFLDTRGLAPGQAWNLRLFQAIDASRFFVPVYSADYFDKDYCQREIVHALRRQRADNVFIVGVDVAGKPLPSPFDGYQAVRAADGDLVPRLVQGLCQALRADAAAAAAPPPAPTAA